MRVLGQRQAEVADVLRLIHRLRHRTHHHRLDQVRLFVADDLLQHRTQILRLQVAIRRQLNAEAAQELPQLLEPILFGLCRARDTASGILCFFRKRAACDVRGDHAFLDQPMRIVARLLDERRNAPVGTESHLEFRRIEIQCAALRSCSVQRLEDCVQIA